MRQSKKVFFLHLFFAFVFCKIYAQQSPYCGTSEFDIILKTLNPNLQKVEDDLNFYQSNYIKSTNYKTDDAVITIPVVIHLIGTSANSKINEAKVIEQLNILNDVFRNRGTYSNSNGVDTRIEFCLATQDPDGYATTGILHIPTNLHDPYTKTNQDDIDLKNLSHWDPKSYLNIWVCDLAEPSLGGYGSFPSYFMGGNSEFRDGIVMSHNFFGLTGNSYSGQGLVLVHEIGHWLNLYHTFQRQKDPNTGLLETPCFNDDCYSNGDYCCDTPPVWSINNPPLEDGGNYYCPTGANTCHTDVPDLPDLINNFMDYTNDACKDMFTIEQKKKMQITLSGVRGSLFNSKGCSPGINTTNPNPNPDPITVDLGSSITVFHMSGSGGTIESGTGNYSCKNCIGNGFEINNQPKRSVAYVCESENITITSGCLDFNLVTSSWGCPWWDFNCSNSYTYKWLYAVSFYECNDDLTTIGTEKILNEAIITDQKTPPPTSMYDIRNYAKEAGFTLTPGKFYRFKLMADFNYRHTDRSVNLAEYSQGTNCKNWQEYSIYFFIVPDDLVLEGRSLKASQWSGTNKYIGKNTVTVSNSNLASGQNVDVVAGSTIRITGNTTISGNFVARINNVDCVTPQNAKWDGESITETSAQDTISKTKPKTLIKETLDNTLYNVPNPLSDITTIHYSISNTCMVSLFVYDIYGQKIATLIDNAKHDGGKFAVVFDTKNLSSGIYFYMLMAGNSEETKKMLIIK